MPINSTISSIWFLRRYILLYSHWISRYHSDSTQIVQVVDSFAALYESVDDIDLFIGAISERLAPDALVGPTFQCIIADQFLKLKRGDRFFYDLAGQSGSFTDGREQLRFWFFFLIIVQHFFLEQLTEIRRTSFARLVCDNSNVKSSQPLIFKIPSSV